jgi:transposase-like protein
VAVEAVEVLTNLLSKWLRRERQIKGLAGQMEFRTTEVAAVEVQALLAMF